MGSNSLMAAVDDSPGACVPACFLDAVARMGADAASSVIGWGCLVDGEGRHD